MSKNVKRGQIHFGGEVRVNDGYKWDWMGMLVGAPW